MDLREISLRTYREETPFALLDDRWALLSAGTEGSWNTMTVSWGQMGILWNKEVATVYVRPQRHTLQFMEKFDRFTLSFFPEAFRPALTFCGSHSGRDCDKAAETGLSPVFADGTVWFREADLVVECRKLYVQQLLADCFQDPALCRSNYPGEDYHFCFIGEIEKALHR